MNVVPPSEPDVTDSDPPCPSAIAFARASPRPVPGDSRFEPDADVEDAVLLVARDAVAEVRHR